MRYLAAIMVALPSLTCPSGTIAGIPHAPAHIPMGDRADAPAGFTDMCEATPSQCRAAEPSAYSPTTEADRLSSPAAPILIAQTNIPAAAPAPAMVDPAPAGELLKPPVSVDAKEAVMRNNAFTSAALSSQPADGTNAIEDPVEERSSMRLLKRINHRVNHHVRQTTDLALYGVDELWRASGVGPHAAGDCEDIALEKRAELIQAGMAANTLFLATVYVPGLGLHTVVVARLSEGDFVLDSLSPEIVRWDRLSYIWLRIQSPDNPMGWYRLGPTGNI
jgi:predicted transglutaminase-like cysteine proteinase